jgi:hypothetical protein
MDFKAYPNVIRWMGDMKSSLGPSYVTNFDPVVKMAAMVAAKQAAKK